MKKSYLVLGLLVAAAGSAEAADKVYKWKDANGTVHFSDAPPPKGQQFDNVRIVGQSAAITQTPEQKPADAAATAESGATAAADAQPQTEEQRRAKRCDDARKREGLLASTQILTVKRDGKDVNMPSEDRAAELALARTTMQQYCAAPAE